MYRRGFLREHSSILLLIMRLLDCLIMLAACAAGYVIVFGAVPPPAHYQIAIIIAVLVLIVVFNGWSLYTPWRGTDSTQELTAIVLAWTMVFAILAFLSVITKTSADFSRAWLVYWYTLGMALLLGSRLVLRRSLAHLRSLGYNLRHIVIIASGSVGRHVYTSIRKAPETGFSVIGYFSDDDGPPGDAPVENRGSLAEAPAFVRSRAIDQVWIAMPLSEADKIGDIIHSLRDMTTDIRLVPDIYGFQLINHSVSTIAGLPIINLSVTPMDGVNRWLKAAEDKLIAILVIVLVSPLMLMIAAAIKLTSSGPVLYRQQRMSWNGSTFTMYKFRSMPENAEASTGAVWAAQGEARATPLGRWLRRSSLDELPQFWNVLRGDMSVVGPRPERPEFVEIFKDQIPSYMQKHKVKAGITGWAQVNGWRGNTDLQQRIEHDLYYINNWSIWLDLRIMAMTLFKGFFHANAY